MEWIKLSIAPIKDLIEFLTKKSKTTDIHKKQLFTELRNNLNVFRNGYMNEIPYDKLIDLLTNQAIQEAVKDNFPFKKLKQGKLHADNIEDERNKKYIDWGTEKLLDKIDEKIVELKNIKKMNNDTVVNVKNNIPLMMSNLYYRIKLLVDFIRSDEKKQNPQLTENGGTRSTS
jgi:archaellum component FlaC